MKNNLKTKVMLAVLAGGMLCANGAWADGYPYWYGSGSPVVWKGVYVATFAPDDACTTGANLLVVDNQTVDSITLEDTYYIYGGYSNTPDVDVSDNQITFNLSSAAYTVADIYAGYIGDIGSGIVTGNRLIIGKQGDTAGGTFYASVNGGYNDGTGDATNNSVTIYNGNFGDTINGGYSKNSDATDNTVNIYGGTFSWYINGGQCRSAATGNFVTINGGTFEGSCGIFGGYSVGAVTGNFVTINGGTFRDRSIFGGYSVGSGAATGNFVTINGGTINGNVTGGYSNSGNVTGNSVVIKGGTINNGTVFGGQSYSGDALNNSVTIEGGTFNSVTLYGGSPGSGGSSSCNTLNLKTAIGGTVKEVKYFQNVNFTLPAGATSDVTMLKVDTTPMALAGITFNTNLNGLSLTGNDYITLVKGVDGDVGALSGQTGYYVLTIGSGATAYKELVYSNGTPVAKGDYTIKQGSVIGNSQALGSGTYMSSIQGNTDGTDLTVTGGTLSNTSYNNNEVVIRRCTYSGGIYGANSNSGSSVTGNKVSIYDGTFNSNIYGGYSESGDATGNTVIINGGTFNSNIYGGCSGHYNATNNIVTINGGTFYEWGAIKGGESQKSSSGNILNLNTKVSTGYVNCFQTMNITLPSDIKDGDIVLSAKAVTFDNTVINVKAANGVKLSEDNEITLITTSSGVYGAYTSGNVLGGAGTIKLSGNDLILTLTKDFGGSGDTATTKAIAEGIAASLAFVNQGADMVATSGIDGLYVADSENPAIAAFSGNKTRYNTGSHVDIHGWNALAGVALNNKAGVSYGVFVEVGNADIDTYAALNGSGSSDYKGGGFMVRKDLGKGWTIDGAIRAGRVETSWGNNTKGGYEAKQTYYGAHVTFNKMLKEYGEQKLNGYLRYTFTHLGSDSVNLDGTHYGFDSVNSHRTRLGARMVDEGQNGFELYYGAAWEYGFGGDCDANVNGVTTSGPAVDGSSGVIEVGGTWSDRKWDISAGLEGYAGAKRGIAGGMNFVYKF